MVSTFFRSRRDKDIKRQVRMSFTDILRDQCTGEDQVQSSKSSPRSDGRNHNKVPYRREDHTDGGDDEGCHGPDKEEEREGNDDEKDIKECSPCLAVSDDGPMGLWFFFPVCSVVGGGVWAEETINVSGMLCVIVVPSVRGLSLKRASSSSRSS